LRAGEAFSLDHADQEVGTTLLMEALGTAEPDFLTGRIEGP
jgi:hypothetical protein